MKQNLQMKLSEDAKTASIFIYGDIVSEGWKWYEDEVSSQDIMKALENESIEHIDVFINSFGGLVFEGLAIYTMLSRHKATVYAYIDGIAASISSIIPQAADKVYMYNHTLQMIHNCYTYDWGDANALRKTANELELIMEQLIGIYMKRFKGTREELVEMLDNESLLTAEQCLENGLCDEIISDKTNTVSNAQNSFLTRIYSKKEIAQQKNQQPQIIDNINSVNLSEDSIQKLAEAINVKRNEVVDQKESLEKPMNRFYRAKKEEL